MEMRNLEMAEGEISLLSEPSRWRGPSDPALAYLSLRREGVPSFLLESAERAGESARYSVVGTDPLLHVRVKGEEVMIGGKNRELVSLAMERLRSRGDPMEMVGRALMLDEIKVPSPPVRYALGAFGYVGYDYALSHLGARVKRRPLPEMEFMVPSTLVVFDHLTNEETRISVVPVIDGRRSVVPGEPGKAHPQPSSPPTTGTKTSSSVSRKKFEEMVSAAKEYIRNGEVVQVVLSRRIDVVPAPSAVDFYLRLRKVNPSPYMFLFEFPDRTIVGSSPEALLKVEGRRVITRPIAGTRRLEKGRIQDRVARELLNDEKERAEHVMLVDLGRNDLGRVCRFGSVRVEEFMKIERYSHVVHLVSTVAGELNSGVTSRDALAAAFPAGTVTGAPKVRAMEIIDELEPSRRGVYAGAVGCMSYTGDLDMAIAIRTMVVENGVGSIQVGAGIVADSVPWKEYYETENKARALLEAAACG